MKKLSLLVVLALVMCGCKATGGIDFTPVNQIASLTLVDAARYGITNGLSPRLETAYSQGKVPYPVYLTARGEEAAALDALAGLRSKVLSGQPVTSDELKAAEIRFVAPLETLIDQYAPASLPATQPAR
jgi:hypothetical protein